MHTHDLVIDDRANGHDVEQLGELLPQFYRVHALAGVVEPIYPID